MYNLKYCPNCNNLMTGQHVWIGGEMVLYHVCVSCGGIYTQDYKDEILQHEKKYIRNINAYLIGGGKDE